MDAFFGLLEVNKSWIFSGIGLIPFSILGFVLSILGFVLYRRRLGRSQHVINQNTHDNATSNTHIGRGDINVTNHQPASQIKKTDHEGE